ncbi:DNA oxidative demethylase [Microdochium nivale]|nr:DNA oxidative demethylase [Microdochium nivale]
MAAKKRTIDAFFGSPASKRTKPAIIASSTTKPAASNEHTTAGPDGSSNQAIRNGALESTGFSRHYTYPFPIANLPRPISSEVSSLPSSLERIINNEPDLDLVYYEPYIPRSTARDLFRHLRSSLPFYRVEYDIQRGGISTHIRTPRWTTVFGIDDTSRFAPSASPSLSSPPPAKREAAVVVVDARTGNPVDVAREKLYSGYTHPRPIPKCLDDLRLSTERATGCLFNFCLVNYYASGADSISYHSDDERFLGSEPAIASFSLGARRDFMLKHKPPPAPKVGARGGEQATATAPPGSGGGSSDTKPLKLPLGSGDMILMRGTTQANWLHSIPKRSGKNEADGGRINITFRRAMVKGGTDNYYKYNVGGGAVYTWDELNQEMRPWKQES